MTTKGYNMTVYVMVYYYQGNLTGIEGVYTDKILACDICLTLNKKDTIGYQYEIHVKTLDEVVAV